VYGALITPRPPARPPCRALKILLSEADGQPYDLERNEIIALFNTLNKLSSSLETIDYMSNLLQVGETQSASLMNSLISHHHRLHGQPPTGPAAGRPQASPRRRLTTGRASKSKLCTPPICLVGCIHVRHECMLKLQLKQHNTRWSGWLARRAMQRRFSWQQPALPTFRVGGLAATAEARRHACDTRIILEITFVHHNVI
jgi:hypothetical protein